MFRQVILSAVAITCTLSRTRANSRSTQRLDQKKDLLCVLILSGIQKEDLDASMLQKLQQHNVNIDDLNNEKNVNKCKDVNLQDIVKKIASFAPVKTTVKNDDMTETPRKFINIDSILTAQESFINPVQHKENHSIQSTTTIPTTVAETFNQTHKEVIEYMDGKPKLESVLKFWKSFATNKKNPISVTSNSTVKPISAINEIENNKDPETERNISIYQNQKVKDILDKVLLSVKKLTNSDKEVTSTTKNTIFNNDNDVLLPSIDTVYKLDKPTNSYIFGNIFNKVGSNTDTKIFEQRYPNPNSQKQTTVSTYFNLKEMLATINTKKTYPIAYETHQKKLKNVKEQEAIPKNINLDIGFNPTIDSSQNNASETNLIIPNNVIKHIADSVKAIILRDIRKELQTVPIITTTPAETILLTTQKEVTNEKKRNESTLYQLVLTKFLDLFEHIKALKSNPIIISQDDKNAMKPEDKIQYFPTTQTNALLHLDQHLAARYLSTVNNHIPKNKDFRTSEYNNLRPQIHKFRSHPVIKNKPSKPRKVQKALPIAIQTNAMEIPPIGVLIDKPESPINQNIIVTTMHSNQYRNELNNPYNYVYDPHINLKKINEFRIAPTHAKIQQAHFDNSEFISKETYCYTLDCAQSLKSKSNDKRVDDLKASYKDMNIERYMDYIDTPNKKQRLNTSGFHEILEKMEADDGIPKLNVYRNCCHEKDMTLSQKSYCCPQKISPRQQISLNPNKRVSYDDSHFKNFLKSQQKVTDMLERILAVRNNLRSAENM